MSATRLQHWKSLSNVTPSPSPTITSTVTTDSHKSQNSATSTTSIISLSTNYPAVGDHRFQLELIHKWTSHTCHTFCHQKGTAFEDEERQFWQTIAFHAGLKADYCLSALFAATSLHLSTLIQSQRREYIAVAINFHNISLELYRQELGFVTEQNCEAMYITALAHLVLDIALSEIDQVKEQSVVEKFISTLALFAGAKKIFKLFEKELAQRPIAVLTLQKDMGVLPKRDESFITAMQHLRAISKIRYERVDEQMCGYMLMNVDKLELVAIRCVNGLELAVFGWLMNLDERFVAALQRAEPVPMLMLMHWAILVGRYSSLWWMFKSSDSLIFELSQKLPPLSLQEQAARYWCLGQVTSGKDSSQESQS